MLRKLTILTIAILGCAYYNFCNAQYHPLENQRLSTTDAVIFKDLTVNGPVISGVTNYLSGNTFQLTNQSNVDGISSVSPIGAFRWYTSPNSSDRTGYLYQLRSYDVNNGESAGFLTIRGDGKMGFGTTIDPNYNYAFNGNVIGNSYTVYGGASLSNTGIYTVENMQLRTWDGNNTQTRMFINAINGNIGIGNNNYSSFKLDIGNGTGLQGVRINTGNGNNEGGYLVFAKNNENRFFIGDESAAYGGSGNDATAYVYGNNKFHISTNTYKRLTVDGDGNVGIGIATPTEKLDVDGAINIRGNEYADNVRLNFTASDNTKRFQIKSDFDNNIGNDLLTFRALGIDNILTLKGNGNVGIGTTTPNAHLEVRNNNTTNTSYASIRLTGYGNASGSFGRLEFANTVAYSGTKPRAFIEGFRDAGTDNGFLAFATANDINTDPQVKMLIYPDGRVGIGTIDVPTGYKLAVNGNIISEKVTVKLSVNGIWPDYVFDESYRLQPLNELEKFIQKNKHLPEMPSAAEVEKNGADVGANQALLLKKVEELTLYIIQQQKEIELLKADMNKLKKN